MKIISSITLLLATAVIAAAEPRTLVLTGTVTNITAETSSSARLELTLDGEKATARLTTSPPLVGTGTLAGRHLDGWLELSGQLDEGLSIQFRGGLNARNFRGTYVAKPERGPAQHGSFEFSLPEKP